MAGFDPKQPRDSQGRWTSNGAVAMGVAVTLVASALAGGSVGGAASASGSISRGGSQARTTITSVADDTLRATVRLQRLGRYRATVQLSSDGSACAAHSYGEVHRFFLTNPCRSLHRGLAEVHDRRDRRYAILIAIATVDMPDYDSATKLKELLARFGKGDITQLSRERGATATSLSTTPPQSGPRATQPSVSSRLNQWAERPALLYSTTSSALTCRA